MNFNTSNEPFRKLLGNGILYVVPRFQRDYSWTEYEWDDLWQDIIETCQVEEEASHYMGYLVLQSHNSKKFDIVDGQQRITTLSLLILSVLKHLNILAKDTAEGEDNTKRAEQLRNTYIGYLDPVTLVTRSKLELNRHNDSFYQDYIVPLQPIPQRGLNSSEKLIKKAFEWFFDKVKKDISSHSGMELAGFVDRVVDRLFFTVITVTDELNAFKVFETLNARGVRLSPTDLLKNYLFSVVSNSASHESEIKNIEERWEKIVGKLGGEKFPDFLRFYWNSRNKLVRKRNLFKIIKSKITDREKVFKLIRELDENVDIFAALRNPDDEFWEQDQKKFVRNLKMFSIRQPYSLLMIAYKKLSKNDFNKVLKTCSIISFRYNVICGLHTGEQETTYNDISCKITDGKLKNSTQVLAELKKIYPDDNVFKASFAEKELRTPADRNKKIARYILFEIEKHLSNKSYEAESKKYTIEHILPENPSPDWKQYNEYTDDKFIYRLGNYTLLDKKTNKALANKGYREKIKIYENSIFNITKEIFDKYESWNPENIAKRQKWMAKQATAVWRLNF